MSVDSYSVGDWVPRRPGGVEAIVSWQEPDGSVKLASGGRDGKVRIWDAGTGAGFDRPIAVHAGTVFSITAWQTAAGTRVASTGTDGIIRIMDPSSLAQVGEIVAGHGGGVLSLASWQGSDGATFLASGSYDCSIRIWNAESLEQIGSPLVGHTAAVLRIVACQSPTGLLLVSAGDDGTIRIWDVETGTLIMPPLQGHASAVEDLFCWLSDDGRARLASASEDGTIRIWDLASGVPIGAPWTVDPSGVWSLDGWRMSGGVYLASATGLGSIRIWDVESGGQIGAESIGPVSPVRAMTAWVTSGGEMRLAGVGSEGTIRIWDPIDATVLVEADSGHTAAVLALATWRDADERQLLAAVGTGGAIRIWDADSAVAVGEISTGHVSGAWAMAGWRTVDGEFRLASGGLDGDVRVWDATRREPVTPVIDAHSASVAALSVWREVDGTILIASSGDDGLIRVWDTTTGAPVGARMAEHIGGVLCLTSWSTTHGARRLASGGTDGRLWIWDPATSSPAVATPFKLSSGIWSLDSWRLVDGHVRLAAGTFDGGVYIWDPETGELVVDLSDAHGAPIRAMTHWDAEDGVIMLASAATDAIRVWNTGLGTQTALLRTGHTAAIRSLVSWTCDDGSIRLASASDDGTIRLWNPQTGEAIHTIEVGNIEMWGLSDSPAYVDLLDRQVLVEAIVDQLFPRSTGSPAGPGGPSVITVEGAWGCGKSTLMTLIRDRLLLDRPDTLAPTRRVQRLTVYRAARLLRRTHHADRAIDTPSPGRRGSAVAWFNPWMHQSGEQIWAGLTTAILAAVGPILYPSDAQRETYWFSRNIGRVDRHVLAKMLRRRAASPLLGVAAAAAIIPLAIAIGQLGSTVQIAGRQVTAPTLALLIPLLFLVVGLLHTACRYAFSAAAAFLPAEIFHGPISGQQQTGDGLLANDAAEILTDPMHRARAGSLYLLQHDVSAVLGDIAISGFELTIIIDDLDRCSSATSAEVFEAIGLFLSGLASPDGLRTHFVIGLDPYIVAAHIDRTYAGLDDNVGLYGDDPSPGWAFLRKLVQLPVVVPQVSDAGLSRFVDLTTAITVPTAAPAQPDLHTLATAGHESGAEATPGGRRTVSTRPEAKGIRADDHRSSISTLEPVPKIVPWRILEQHPRVQDMLRRRLAAQPNRSIRESKRLLNVWQLYARVLTSHAPAVSPAAAVDRATYLVIIAEIITRWPALQRQLHRRIETTSGLQMLAARVADDRSWNQAVELLAIDPKRHEGALANLRQLLQEHDGTAVANLAAELI